MKKKPKRSKKTCYCVYAITKYGAGYGKPPVRLNRGCFRSRAKARAEARSYAPSARASVRKMQCPKRRKRRKR